MGPAGSAQQAGGGAQSPRSTPLLRLIHVSKRFDSTRALDDVTLDLHAGEVHVLAGENGAGKSTLIKILSGVYSDYEGELQVNGTPVRFAGPSSALRAGIATIHQELSLVPNLSFVDNLIVSMRGSALASHGRAAARAMASRLLDALELSIDPERLVEELPLSDRQLLEIARALGHDARVLVMDEPTSALSEGEAALLFDKIRLLKQSGTAMLYISHRLEEIDRLADRTTVLRDGRVVLTRSARDLSRDELVLAMLGRELSQTRHRRAVTHRLPKHSERPLLSVERLSDAGRPPLRGVTFELWRGEIVGVAGLRGSGAARILSALFGGERSLEGTLTLDGRPYVPSSPSAAVRQRVMFLPRDRRLSVFAELSIRANATLSSLDRFCRGGWIDSHRERLEVERRIPELRIRPALPELPTAALSGGNQQKTAILRCLLTEPQVLLLDDPTRGVDIGAKADIYELLGQLADHGLGILLHSSELDELAAVCNRVLVLYQGALVCSVEGEALTRERLLVPMMGAAAAHGDGR